jgi:hypothetical protein
MPWAVKNCVAIVAEGVFREQLGDHIDGGVAEQRQ